MERKINSNSPEDSVDKAQNTKQKLCRTKTDKYFHLVFNVDFRWLNFFYITVFVELTRILMFNRKKILKKPVRDDKTLQFFTTIGFKKGEKIQNIILVKHDTIDIDEHEWNVTNAMVLLTVKRRKFYTTCTIRVRNGSTTLCNDFQTISHNIHYCEESRRARALAIPPSICGDALIMQFLDDSIQWHVQTFICRLRISEYWG